MNKFEYYYNSLLGHLNRFHLLYQGKYYRNYIMMLPRTIFELEDNNFTKEFYVGIGIIEKSYRELYLDCSYQPSQLIELFNLINNNFMDCMDILKNNVETQIEISLAQSLSKTLSLMLEEITKHYNENFD